MYYRCWKYILCLFVFIIHTEGDEDYASPRHYVLNLTQTAYEDAVTICSENGGFLATIYDYSTIPDLQLDTFLKDTDEALVWIGLKKVDDGTRIWDSGEELTYNNWDTASILESDCTATTFRKPYTWTNQRCGLRLPFLCQFDGGECRFDVYKNASIAAHNYMYLYQKSAEECKEVCLTSSVFLCQSFEYDADGRRCQFNSGNRWTLPLYYASHQDWDYYHRTCNSGEVTGTLLDLSPPVTSSIADVVSSTSSSISPTSTFIPETSTVEIQCSEMFTTKDVFITHDVYQTHLVTVTRDVFMTREIPVTRDVFITNDVILSTTVTETAVVTIRETSTVTLTPSPVFFLPSESVYQDPVEELMELETVIKEKAKSLTKVSVMDDRPSATYVGYFAILFLSCVFGSILLFDMLTIFQSGFCQKCMKACKGKKRKLAPSSRKASSGNKGETIASIASYELGKDGHEGGGERNDPHTTSDKRLWRKSLWAFGDSGFGGSNSEETNSDTASYTSSVRNTTEVVTVEIQDTDNTCDNTTSPGSSEFASTSITSADNTVDIDGNTVADVTTGHDIEYDDLGVDRFGSDVHISEDRTTHL